MKKKLFGFLAMFVAACPFMVNAAGEAVKIGGTSYPTLKEAVEAVEVCNDTDCETTTINVVASHETSGIIFASGKHIVVDLGGFTVTFKEPTVGSKGTETIDMQILKDSTITFKNGKFVSSNTESSKMFIQNYANLTLRDVEIIAMNDLNLYALSNNSGDVSIEGNTSIKAKKVAFDVCGYHSYPIGPKVVVDTTGVIEGTIEVTKVIKTEVTRELSLLVKNIKHIGNIDIQEGLESFVTFQNGSYTDDKASEIVKPEEGSDVYSVVDSETGETKYVVAADNDVEQSVYETDSWTAKEFEESLEELKKDDSKKELLAELDKVLSGKTTVSVHNLFYGSFIGNDLIVDSNVSELKKGVEVKLNIPETLEKVKDGYSRKYSIVRIHINDDGEFEVTVLDAKENKDGTVVAETDKFSTYILTYEDVKNPENPKTYDGIGSYVIFGSLALVLLAVIGVFSKKKLFN